MNYDLMPEISEALWPDIILKYPSGAAHAHRPPIKSQGAQRKCGAFSVASGIECLRSIALLPHVNLDADEMYDRMPHPGGGLHLGEVIEEALIVGYKPLGRLTKVLFCPTFKHQMSAILSGHPVISIMEWKLTYVPDSTGWARDIPGSITDSHEIFGYKPAMRPDGRGNWEYGIWHQNTTGEIGKRQLVLSEKQMTGSPGSGQGFALVSVYDEGV